MNFRQNIYANEEDFIYNSRIRIITSPDAPLSILSFPKGSMHASFPDGIKYPGIYGTLFCPNELLDTLYIDQGKNREKVRFASQFILTQEELNFMIEAGSYVELTSELQINMYYRL